MQLVRQTCTATTVKFGDESVQLGSAKDCLVAALRADGKVAAVGHNDGGVYLWDVDSRLPLPRRLSAGISAVADLRFSESGDRLVSTTIKGTIRVWRTDF